MSIRKIIKGTVKNILGQGEDLYQQRINICRGCKLIKIDNIFGEMCNKHLYIHPVTGEVSKLFKKGFITGCGCVLGSKTRDVENKCPLGKW